MRINKVVGISIGNYRISVSYVVKGQLKSYFYENVPDNAVKDGMIQYWDAMSEFLRDTLKQHGIKCKNVIFSVPLNGVYIRNIELPLMNLQQLELNLPFEFHDYISESSDKYFYDYAVIEKTDKSMRLQAVACSKELIERYRKMAKAAKLVPIGLVPEVIGIQRILGAYKQQFSIEEQKDFAILDMGDQSFKIHFYNKGIYNATRTFEPGGYALAEKISEINGTDIHISHLALEENLNNIQSHPSLVQMYENRAVEIMRALNFYSYSNNNNNIDTLYYCGGVSNIRKYIKVLSETVNLPVRPLGDLVAVMDDEVRDSFISCPQSHGITVDPDYEPKPLTAEEADRFRAHIEKYEQQKIDSFKDEEYRGTVEKPVSETKLNANDTDLNSLASQVSKAVEAESQAAPMPAAIPTPMPAPEPIVQPAVQPVVEAVQQPIPQPVPTNVVPVIQTDPEPVVQPIVQPVVETVQQPVVTDAVPEIKPTPEPVVQPVVDTIQQPVFSNTVPVINPTPEPVIQPVVNAVQQQVVTDAVPVIKPTPEPVVQQVTSEVVPLIIPTSEPETSETVPVSKFTPEPETQPIIKPIREPVITEWAVSAPLSSQDLKQFTNNSELKPIGLEEHVSTMEAKAEPVQNVAPVIKDVAEPVQEKLPVIKSVEEPVVRNAPPVIESVSAPVQEISPVVESVTPPVQEKPTVVESLIASVQDVHSIANPTTTSVQNKPPVIESVVAAVQEASVKETSPVIESVTPPVQEASPVVNAVEEKQEPPMFSRDISEDELEQQAFDLIRSLAKKSSDGQEAESSTNNDTKTEESSENDFAARLIRLNDYMDDPVKESDDQWVKHLDEDEYDTDTDRAIEELTERFLKGQTS
ncbi:pilus assembly protein PilM [Oribacterium sp. KHPX15]|uniref:pilus assembly protein PilM n=1 Tax=Oribacterium sp. KHPX15 TaxID=1855342 RepID=UPI001587C893|nr:pilus assembly protein PilM [Oribacterium sp. KHPX15]